MKTLKSNLLKSLANSDIEVFAFHHNLEIPNQFFILIGTYGPKEMKDLIHNFSNDNPNHILDIEEGLGENEYIGQPNFLIPSLLFTETLCIEIKSI